LGFNGLFQALFYFILFYFSPNNKPIKVTSTITLLILSVRLFDGRDSTCRHFSTKANE